MQFFSQYSQAFQGKYPGTARSKGVQISVLHTLTRHGSHLPDLKNLSQVQALKCEKNYIHNAYVL